MLVKFTLTVNNKNDLLCITVQLWIVNINCSLRILHNNCHMTIT